MNIEEKVIIGGKNWKKLGDFIETKAKKSPTSPDLVSPAQLLSLGVKRKSNNDARNKNNEKYEAYRKWLFLSSWATDRPWLQNDDEKGMTRKICVEHYGPIQDNF